MCEYKGAVRDEREKGVITIMRALMIEQGDANDLAKRTIRKPLRKT